MSLINSFPSVGPMCCKCWKFVGFEMSDLRDEEFVLVFASEFVFWPIDSSIVVSSRRFKEPFLYLLRKRLRFFALRDSCSSWGIKK